MCSRHREALVVGLRDGGQARAGRACLLDLKLVRLTRDPRHLDSIIDLAGYTGCLAEVLRDA